MPEPAVVERKRHVAIDVRPHFHPGLGVWGAWLSLNVTNPVTRALVMASESFVHPPQGVEVSGWGFVWGEITRALDPDTPVWWKPLLEACGMTRAIEEVAP